MAGFGALLLLLWLVVNGLIVLVYRRNLWWLWRDPVFKCPILIVESDDWGAGPLAQAAALRDIADLLGHHRDATGRAPTLNLALVLAVPDGPAIQAGGYYRRIFLDDPILAPVLSALLAGQSRGVFALQLHGLEHCWPDALMSSDDTRVRDWLAQPVPAASEDLPSHLQCRWADASSLPSKPHATAAIQAAVAEEVQTYARILRAQPKVVVPPTFVWTRDVEQAWADHGLECVVTPGWRYTCRNAGGLPGGDEGPIANGDRTGSLTCLVRTDYFEPARGRDAAYALRALDRAASEGRPCLLENHRDNFVGDPRTRQRSLRELDMLYREALIRYPNLRFLSSWELCRILQSSDPQWLSTGFAERASFFWLRCQHSGRLWKMMSLTGLVAVCTLAVQLFNFCFARMPSSSET